MLTFFDLLKLEAEETIDREYTFIPKEPPKRRSYYDFDRNYEETA